MEQLRLAQVILHMGPDGESEHQGDEPLIRFAGAYFARVVRSQLNRDTRVKRHRKIAEALAGRRRRSASVELATHLIGGQLPLQAYPVLINAARRTMRAGNLQEVFAICERALAIRDACESELDYTDSVRLRRWLFMIYGEAHLSRGNWPEAAEALERAVAAARIETDGTGLGRCLADLGRAYYRLGQYPDSVRALNESLSVSDPGAAERAAATRVLADISLQEGKLEQAEHLWSEALDYAIANQSHDGEARARRGIAHLRALQHRYLDASQLL